ncbi:MAG: histidine phosphatase family protein [Ktedonobacteraceae bacterium]|nr:histidine phosphatase family protein [Ktedonobacteraceae bacterium]
MLTLFYSFHATSVDNEAGRASGHADVPLSTLGQQQARELGQRYMKEVLDVIFSSDLQRASTTAKIAFSAHALPFVLDVRLREYNYGDLTQGSIVQIEEERRTSRITEPFPNGESVLMATQRVGAFLRDVLHDYDGKTIVVIGHAITKWAIEYWCSDASLEKIVQAPYEWRDTNIWRYELHTYAFEQRFMHLQP